MAKLNLFRFMYLAGNDLVIQLFIDKSQEIDKEKTKINGKQF